MEIKGKKLKLLGIHGFKQSGKDTAARMVRQTFTPMQLIAFADRLKEMCSVTFGVPLWVFYDNSLKEQVWGLTCMTPRQMMLSLSDVTKHTYGLHFFLKPVQDKWAQSKETGLIVTDVRYEYEAQWIRDEGGVILHIHRPGCEKSDHSSEQGIAFDKADYAIGNTGDLDDLKSNVRNFCNWWVGPLDYYG